MQAVLRLASKTVPFGSVTCSSGRASAMDKDVMDKKRACIVYARGHPDSRPEDGEGLGWDVAVGYSLA